MENRRKIIFSTALIVLAAPLAGGLTACGEDNPAQRALEDQKQQLQDQAAEAINQQTEEAQKRAQDALEQAKGKANDAIDQAQSQVDEAIPPAPSR